MRSEGDGMTREEAIAYFEERLNYNPHNGNPAAERLAIEALRTQQELESKLRVFESNEPLTMDELRKMDGEPVWVSVSNNWRESGVSEGWCLVRFRSEDDRVRVYIYDTRHGARFFTQQDYGISWFAYRRKPEKVEV